MQVRRSLRRHGDLVLAVVLAVIFATEVLLWDGALVHRALPAALLATLPLALRRRAPLVAFLLSSTTAGPASTVTAVVTG